ncbi:MAG: DUF998 domain-containing protein [Acidimicrobiia bacterium]
MQQDTTTRRLATGGALAPIFFVTLVIVAGLAYTGYSHIGQKISELGGREAEHPILQNATFVITGLLVVGLAWALARVGGRWSAGPLLVAYFGVSGTIVQGFLPCDPGCKPETAIGVLHIVTGLSGFIAATIAMFVLARVWRETPSWSSHAGFSRASGIAAAAGLVGFAITQAAEIEPIDGLVQRLMVAVLLLWIGVTGYRVRDSLDAEPAPSAEETAVVR